jgi:hypothetical protein
MTAALPSLTLSATSLDYTIMALRRPPTRVELKADDIEEYNEVRACACSIVNRVLAQNVLQQRPCEVPQARLA